MGHRGRALLTAWLALMAVMLLVAGTTTWRMRSHVATCILPEPSSARICTDVPVAPADHRLHPLRAELLWAGGAAAGAGALMLAASARRRAPRVAQPAGG